MFSLFNYNDINNISYLDRLIISFLFEEKRRKKFFKKIGEGTARTSYQLINSNIVLKEIKEKNNTKQNKNEIILYKRAKNLFQSKLLCPVVKLNEETNIMPKVKAFPSDFIGKDIVTKEELNFIEQFECFEGLEIPFNNIKKACLITKTDFIDFIEQLAILREKIDIDVEDLYMTNLGIYNNKLVILDYGLIGS